MNKIIQGCMRINNLSDDELYTLVTSEMEKGIVFFDHADIYGKGECEAKFGKLLANHPELRQKMIIQTKVGICKDEVITHFNSSKEYIINQVNQSIKKLNCTYLDYLLIHRPDALMNPQEISEAFDILFKEGKVKHFGVSNFSESQISYLQSYCVQRLEVNQLQLSLCHTSLIDGEFYTNTKTNEQLYNETDLLYYCRKNRITIQCWSPFQYGFFEGVFIDNDKFPELNKVLEELAKKYDCSKNAIAVSWLLKIPGEIQVIIGSTNLKRVLDCTKANEITLTREEWYKLYVAAGHKLP